MGLREIKAQRNRERIVSEALHLFARDGYEETTMESIAKAAEISPSTLYRTFPSKDLIVLERVTVFTQQFAEAFQRHAENHPLDEALGEAIFAVLEDKNPQETLLVRSIIDQSPIARARLWDYMAEQHRQLARVIAQKAHAKADDLHVVLTAQLAVLVFGMAADRWRDSGGALPSRATATALMRLLRDGAVIFPRPAGA